MGLEALSVDALYDKILRLADLTVQSPARLENLNPEEDAPGRDYDVIVRRAFLIEEDNVHLTKWDAFLIYSALEGARTPGQHRMVARACGAKSPTAALVLLHDTLLKFLASRADAIKPYLEEGK